MQGCCEGVIVGSALEVWLLEGLSNLVYVQAECQAGSARAHHHCDDLQFGVEYDSSCGAILDICVELDKLSFCSFGRHV